MLQSRPMFGRRCLPPCRSYDRLRHKCWVGVCFMGRNVKKLYVVHGYICIYLHSDIWMFVLY